MRDIRFISKYRGGLLDKNEHILLSRWASICAEHVLNMLGDKINEKLIEALNVSKEWREGKTSVNKARKAALEAFNVAKNSSNTIEKMVACSIGHAVATAHMADHSLVASIYALKAVKILKGSFEDELKWQEERLPNEIKDLVISKRCEDKYKNLLKK